MPTKYLIQKMKGAFYAGSEKLAEKGLTLRKYLDLNSVINMLRSLRLPGSSLVFRGVSKNEQKKIQKNIAKSVKKTASVKTTKTKVKKTKAKK